jgi:hypothetical protein
MNARLFSSSFQLENHSFVPGVHFPGRCLVKGDETLLAILLLNARTEVFYLMRRRLLTAGFPDLSASFPGYIHTLGVEDIYFGIECKIYTVSTYMPLGLRLNKYVDNCIRRARSPVASLSRWPRRSIVIQDHLPIVILSMFRN